MKLFRSEEMTFCSLAVSKDFAWEIINELGELDALQFLDLNAHESGFTRPYSNQIKRCEGIESKLSLIESEINRFNKKIIKCEDPKQFLKDLKAILSTRHKAEHTYIEEVERELDQKVASLNAQIQSYETLLEKFNHYVEYKQVLLKCRPYVLKQNIKVSKSNVDQSKAEYYSSDAVKFDYLAGVLDTEYSQQFQRILFRVTRGTTLSIFSEIRKPAKKKEKSDSNNTTDKSAEISQKTAFLIIYQSGPFNSLKSKLNKLCDSFGVSKYEIPETPLEIDHQLKETDNQIKELENVIQITRTQIGHFVDYYCLPRKDEGNYSLIEELKMFIQKEKLVYHNLNLLRFQGALYRGSCWCPSDLVQKVQDRINQLNKDKANIGSCTFQKMDAPPGSKPPTYFRTNQVTWVFQEIVNTYGFPRYREINPGLFTIATFPFLFGVMFGDIGHGGLLLAAGVYLIFWRKKIQDDKESIWNMALPLRYLLLLQGFFAFYCGLIYNDFMSIPWRLFGSCYNQSSNHLAQIPKTSFDCNSPLGIDPGWYGSANELTFLNSFKMKLSVILGVSHMLFGILLRGLNNIYFRQWLDFFFEFLPMLIFLSLTFGYMVILIFLKWSLPWGTTDYPISQAPSIIGIFIKMILQPGEWPQGADIPLYGDIDGNYQAKLQQKFLITAFLCALCILIPKPLILWLKNRFSSSSTQGYIPQEDEIMVSKQNKEALLDDKKKKSGHHNDSHFDFGEIFVHQVIETIEFVLGSISNTASYLRLWALSLAHSQLAKVFFGNFLGSAIESGSFLKSLIGYYVFANITLSVLLLMDQMECFLHALRLHWVEFQNKFYKADGIDFIPFSFERHLKNGH